MEILTWLQGIYFLFTGIWPLISIGSFQKVTGPKYDLWLVKTAGAVVTAIGGTLIIAAIRDEYNAPIIFLAIGSAVGLAAIDIVYVIKRVIRPIYLSDAAIELLLTTGWGLCLWLGPTV